METCLIVTLFPEVPDMIFSPDTEAKCCFRAREYHTWYLLQILSNWHACLLKTCIFHWTDCILFSNWNLQRSFVNLIFKIPVFSIILHHYTSLWKLYLVYVRLHQMY